MPKRLLVIVAFFALTRAALPQSAAESPAAADRSEIRKQAVEFLRETLSEINNMRSLENRISFTSEMASLMWFEDEREARSLFGAVVNDFLDLLRRYDAQMNSLPQQNPDDQPTRGLMGDISERSKIERKLRTAVGVRQQIAMSIAEHDPDLAFAFYTDSLSAISNPDFRKQMESGNSYFETQLMSQMAEANTAKAAEVGRRSLEKGFNNQQVELLKKLHAKDPDRAAELAAGILGRVRGERSDSVNMRALSSLLEWAGTVLEASRKSGGKRAPYSPTELRDIADLLAQAIMARGASEAGFAARTADLIDRYSPGRGAQVRAKFPVARNAGPGRARRDAYTAMPPPPARGAAISTSGSGSGVGNANAARIQNEREQLERAEKRMFADMAKLANKELPEEERAALASDVRGSIARMPGAEKRIAAYAFLATQLNKAGDKQLASEVLRDASSLVNPQPKNYRDFMLSWVLATGYASADPSLAFPLLEDTIYRANDTIAAFIKVAEFIDVGEEIIADGELQVGAFGGSMVRGLTKELGMADSTIQMLARTDLTRTRDLTNRFDRLEVRILAKMLVLRAILDQKKPGFTMDGSVSTEQELFIEAGTGATRSN